MPTRARTVILGVAAFTGLFSCGYDPGHSNLEWTLDPSTHDALDEAGLADASAQVDGALTTLFGVPSAPRHLTTEDMYDAEAELNATKWTMSDEDLEALYDDNRMRRFRFQLELIQRSEYASVTEPRYAQDLWEIWQRDFAPLHTGIETTAEDGTVSMVTVDPNSPMVPDDEEYGTWHEEAFRLFESWYPTLAESAEMYRMQCLHCHGVNGDGNGPTAPFLDPRPRDYRLGVFKWVAVDNGAQPRRVDLRNILERGVVSTAMPSFKRFSRGELEGLVDYVRLLSMRGMSEKYLTADLVASDSGDLSMEGIQDAYELAWSKFVEAQDKFVAGDVQVMRFDQLSDDERIALEDRGAELFLTEGVNCYQCHGPDGRGIDSPVLLEDGKFTALFEPQEEVLDDDGNPVLDDDGVPLMTDKVMKTDNWGNPSNPRNFTRSVFRGGNRPIDLYRRIKYGIGGSIMPALGAQYTDDDVWALVAYLYKMSNKFDLATVYYTKQEELAKQRAAHHGGHDDDHGGDHGDGHEGDDQDGDTHSDEEEAGH